MRSMRGSVRPFITLILASSLFGACSKSPFSFLSGKDIVFTAETQVEETKVAYSGQTEGNFERIDWKDGDRIRVFSNKALTWKRDGSAGNPQATYVIKGNTVTADGRFSRANVSVVNSQDEGGLQWDETVDDHIFMALYPDQMPSGASSFVYGPAGNRFPCSFNTVQPHSQSGTSDMSYAYLFARTKVNRAQTREVKLSFYPLFTAFEFQLVDGENNNPTWNLKKLELISNKSICGKEKWRAMYQYDHLDWSYDDTAEGHNSVMVDNINATLPTNTSNPKFIQFFGGMNTDVEHQLTLKLTFEDGVVRTLDLQQDGQWIPYPRGQKAVFKVLVKNKSMSFTYSCQAIDLTHEDATNKISW